MAFCNILITYNIRSNLAGAADQIALPVFIKAWKKCDHWDCLIRKQGGWHDLTYKMYSHNYVAVYVPAYGLGLKQQLSGAVCMKVNSISVSLLFPRKGSILTRGPAARVILQLSVLSSE